ncbi:hypothetical protein [Leptospira stimsonii]|uniref:hypothetical protein n=1 Tax=Leptospira stimsonii TaxID=2202203 RepID=UPI0011C3DC4E|nr:hypothetical protein [Leptospira stimsonii]
MKQFEFRKKTGIGFTNLLIRTKTFLWGVITSPPQYSYTFVKGGPCAQGQTTSAIESFHKTRPYKSKK